jgi:hypothetical protein
MPGKTPPAFAVTRTARRFIRGGTALTARPEVWETRSADGEWSVERQDETGTPWSVWHLPSVADGTLTRPLAEGISSRHAAEKWITSGGAAEWLPVLRCPHPAGQVTTRHGTQRSHYVCAACGGTRWTCLPGCHDCTDGTPHEWHPDRRAAA